jgi:hypothetical protein
MNLRRNTRKRKLQKAARKAAKSAPPPRSLALIAAAVLGLIAAVIARKFLGGRDADAPSAPDVEAAGPTWAPQPQPSQAQPAP